ncbi:hypothetical protein BDR26DRAFT_940126 [Obelidium mucronatum]|nr:hypothetical protein BDR26DRAFT_940126 [Obelidium mucronatum]
MRTHYGIKPYVCYKEDCARRFARRDNMVQHYRSHFKVRKSKCGRKYKKEVEGEGVGDGGWECLGGLENTSRHTVVGFWKAVEDSLQIPLNNLNSMVNLCLKESCFYQMKPGGPVLVFDILSQVLMHIPISSNLVSVALASKHLLAPLLLADHSFARRHCSSHLQAYKLPVWDFLERNGLTLKGWESLPFKYKVALFHVMMTTNDIEAKREPEHQNGFYSPLPYRPYQWKLEEWQMLKLIKTLFVVYPNFNPGSQEDRLLQWAVNMRQKRVIEMLLKDPRVCPLESTKLYLEWRAGEYIIALHRAVLWTRVPFASLPISRWKEWEPILFLLLQDARVDITDDFLQDLFKWGGADALAAALENPSADFGMKDNLLLSDACASGDLKLVRIILSSSRVDPTAGNNYPLRIAYSRGHRDVVDLLLHDERVDITPEERSIFEICLRDVCDKGDVGTVKYLLSSPLVDPGVSDNYPIRAAYANGNTEIVQFVAAGLSNRVDAEGEEIVFSLWKSILDDQLWAKKIDSKEMFSHTVYTFG